MNLYTLRQNVRAARIVAVRYGDKLESILVLDGGGTVIEHGNRLHIVEGDYVVESETDDPSAFARWIVPGPVFEMYFAAVKEAKAGPEPATDDEARRRFCLECAMALKPTNAYEALDIAKRLEAYLKTEDFAFG